MWHTSIIKPVMTMMMIKKNAHSIMKTTNPIYSGLPKMIIFIFLPQIIHYYLLHVQNTNDEQSEFYYAKQ